MERKDAKNIEKDWLEKELVDLLCDGIIDCNVMQSWFEIEARWLKYVSESNARLDGNAIDNCVSDCNSR